MTILGKMRYTYQQMFF